MPQSPMGCFQCTQDGREAGGRLPVHVVYDKGAHDISFWCAECWASMKRRGWYNHNELWTVDRAQAHRLMTEPDLDPEEAGRVACMNNGDDENYEVPYPFEVP